METGDMEIDPERGQGGRRGTSKGRTQYTCRVTMYMLRLATLQARIVDGVGIDLHIWRGVLRTPPRGGLALRGWVQHGLTQPVWLSSSQGWWTLKRVIRISCLLARYRSEGFLFYSTLFNYTTCKEHGAQQKSRHIKAR